MLQKVILVGFNAGDYTATVRPYGSLSAYLSGIAVARNIPGAEMVTGRTCAMLVFDEANATDAVIVAVFIP